MNQRAFKNILLAAVFMIFGFSVFALSNALATHNSIHGRIIALDSGHGSDSTDAGAVGYCGNVEVVEADVNFAVRASLKAKLEADGAVVYDVPRLASRRDRVAAAEGAGAEILISIHHNGSLDTSVDYTQTFMTQKRDKALAAAVHPALVLSLGLPDHGIKNDGFGMTVYGKIPSILTEAYFITNPNGACEFLDGTRVTKEVGGFYNGITAYFSSLGSGGRGKGR